MQGEIIIADLLAAEAARKTRKTTHSPTTDRPAKSPLQEIHDHRRDQEREVEWLEDYLHRQHLHAMHKAYEEFGAANAIEKESEREAELAKVRERWGKTLEEALERMAKVRKWQRRVYAPRVAAWHVRMGNRPVV